MYVQLVSAHGLVRGSNIEMGRDADTGGQVRYVVELARSLAESPDVSAVDLFTRQIRDKRVSPAYAEPIERLGKKCRIVRLPFGGGKYHRKEKLWPHLDDFADAMISFSRREGRVPSVVHGHYADAGKVALEVASVFGAAFAFTGHSLGRHKMDYLLEQGWTEEAIDREFAMRRRVAAEEECIASADLVVASTRHELEEQYGRYENGHNARFEVVPPGVDLQRFFPYYEYEVSPDRIEERFKQARVRMSNELRRFHFDPGKPMILALCRPDRRKNIGALIEAYGEDKELQAMANLAVFAGIRRDIGEMADAERDVLVDILLAMDRYDLYGKMAVPKRHDSELDVPELYRLVASQRGVFVNAAFVEPFGLTFIEAAAAGLPFVGTKDGGPTDIVANCDSGLIVDVTKREELGAAIKKLLVDRELWDRLSTNGVNRTRKHYAWAAHRDRYVELLKEIVRKPAKTAPVVSAMDGSAIANRLASLDSLLVSDIDNTLLGDDEALERLADSLKENRGRLGFGVASGRYLEMVDEALGESGLAAAADVVVSSVGTEIYYGPDRAPDKGWASHLRHKWKPDRVHEALDRLPFLRLQRDAKTQREFKISYDLDQSLTPEKALPKIHAALAKAKAAYSLVFSHGAFVDVLPFRASKGKAIRYLAGKWNFPIQRIATAGDSGNDRDMLRGQTAGIVVGNYDAELESLRQSGGRVYFARARCAGGILEGLRHYGFLEAPGGAESGGRRAAAVAENRS